MKIVNFWIFVAIMGPTLSGCTAHRTESAAGQKFILDYSPPYSVVLAPMTPVTVGDVRAYQDGEYFVVSGRVKRTHKVRLPGHLDLTILGPDGKLLARETTRIPGLASTRKGVLALPFCFRPAMVPAERATIRLRYHAPASGNAELNCKK